MKDDTFHYAVDFTGRAWIIRCDAIRERLEQRDHLRSCNVGKAQQHVVMRVRHIEGNRVIHLSFERRI